MSRRCLLLALVMTFYPFAPDITISGIRRSVGCIQGWNRYRVINLQQIEVRDMGCDQGELPVQVFRSLDGMRSHVKNACEHHSSHSCQHGLVCIVDYAALERGTRFLPRDVL